MKKLFSVVALFAMAIGLFSCGPDSVTPGVENQMKSSAQNSVVGSASQTQAVSAFVFNNTNFVLVIQSSQTYTIQPGQTMLVVVQDQLPLVTLNGAPYDYQSGAFDSGETYSVDPPSQGQPVEFVDNGKPKKKVVYAPMTVTPKK